MVVINDITSYDEHIEKGSIGRHETFTPRYGWLKKGYDAVKKDGAVFKAEDAVERLGVGKNMVRSIRFWCNAFKIIESCPEGSGLMVTTKIGDELLRDGGWDPYLEDIASIWLLQWQLFVPPLTAVNWPIAFNNCNALSFDQSQLSQTLQSAAQKYPRLASISKNTFKRDASCLIRMYTEEKPNGESEIGCPFGQLGLMHRVGDKKEFSFSNIEKVTLPPLIFAAASFSYMCSYVPAKQRTISLQRLTYNLNSPGVVFKIPESVVGSHLFLAEDVLKQMSLKDSLGAFQLYLDANPEDLYWQSLENYYEGK